MVHCRHAAQIRHHKIHRAVPIQIAEFDAARIVESRQDFRIALRPAWIQSGDAASPHIARQQDMVAAFYQTAPAQMGDRRGNVRVLGVTQLLHDEPGTQLGLRILPPGKDQLLRST
ncbi:MAG: hypothetical protein H8E44_48145 [Planctomycetes bacterium]|nr:hypothetical protein [Planctomycetota bacterium]